MKVYFNMGERKVIMGIDCHVEACNLNKDGKCTNENILACYLRTMHPVRVNKEDEHLFQKNKTGSKMGLKEALEIYDSCLEESPFRSEVCFNCPLGKPINEAEEHPTFCEALSDIDNKFQGG